MRAREGCERAITARCRAAWGKLRRLIPILTNKQLSPKIRGKMFTACVRSTMLHGSETWAPNPPDLQRLHGSCSDRAMIRWICGTKLDDDISTVALHQKLGVVKVTSILRTRRIRWFGHVQRASTCINSVTSMEIPGRRGRGRPRRGGQSV